MIEVDKEISTDLRYNEQAKDLIEKIKEITNKGNIAKVDFSNVKLILSNFGSFLWKSINYI